MGCTLAELYGPGTWASAREAFGSAIAGQTMSYEWHLNGAMTAAVAKAIAAAMAQGGRTARHGMDDPLKENGVGTWRTTTPFRTSRIAEGVFAKPRGRPLQAWGAGGLGLL